MPQNLPSIDDIAADAGLLAELDIESIAILIDDAKARAQTCTAVSRSLQGEVEARFKDQIASAYLAEGKDTGTVRIALGAFELVADRTKKVEWSQPDLQLIHERIRAANDDPAQYIDVTMTVPERKFSAWPDSMQAQFLPARTVKPGTTSIKLVKAA